MQLVLDIHLHHTDRRLELHDLVALLQVQSGKLLLQLIEAVACEEAEHVLFYA